MAAYWKYQYELSFNDKDGKPIAESQIVSRENIIPRGTVKAFADAQAATFNDGRTTVKVIERVLVCTAITFENGGEVADFLPEGQS